MTLHVDTVKCSWQHAWFNQFYFVASIWCAFTSKPGATHNVLFSNEYCTGFDIPSLDLFSTMAIPNEPCCLIAAFGFSEHKYCTVPAATSTTRGGILLQIATRTRPIQARSSATRVTVLLCYCYLLLPLLQSLYCCYYAAHVADGTALLLSL